ncbi:MAG: hypothetical protein ACHQ50_11215 [Fimbriimonadales bacterium]
MRNRIPYLLPSQRPVDNGLLRAAALQGRAWARSGADVQAKLERHAPFWPKCQRLSLVEACLKAAGEERP